MSCCGNPDRRAAAVPAKQSHKCPWILRLLSWEMIQMISTGGAVSKRFLHLRLHRFVHFDQRRPAPNSDKSRAGAFGVHHSFLRRLNAEFAVHVFTSGLRVLSFGNMEKSRSA